MQGKRDSIAMMFAAGWLLVGATFFSTAGCTVDTGFLEGKPCGDGGVCASGYFCVREPCFDGHLCTVCRKNPGGQDAGSDGEPDGTDGLPDDGGDEPPSCSQTPPPCKSLPDCQDVVPECIDDFWVCDTGYEETESSCDFLDNDCDGLTDTGLVCRLAGNGEAGFNDGTGEQARFDHPRALIGLPLGDLLVADLGNHAIRKVAPDGTTTTLAGSGQGGHQDGPGEQARFREPAGLALSIDGTVLVADRLNHRIRQIDVSGAVSTLAGSGFIDYQDGPVDQAQFAFPTGLAVSGDGLIFVADTGNHCIRKIAEGQVTTFAGRCEYPGIADGDAATARFNGPTDLLLLPDGRLLVSEESSHRIRVVDPDGTVSTLAGDGQHGFADGALATARFAKPAGMIPDPVDDSYLVADSGNHRVRAIGIEVSTSLGSGHPGLADGPPDLVEFDHPSGLAFLGDGRLVIADTNNHMLRVLNP